MMHALVETSVSSHPNILMSNLSRDVPRHPIVPSVLTKLSHVRLPSPIPGCPQTSYGTWCALQVVPCPLTLTYPGMSPDILWYLVCSPSCPMSAYPHLSRDVPRHPMVPGVLSKLSHVRLPSPIPGCPQTSYGTWCAHQVVPCLLILTLCPRMSPHILWSQTSYGTWCAHQITTVIREIFVLKIFHVCYHYLRFRIFSASHNRLI